MSRNKNVKQSGVIEVGEKVGYKKLADCLMIVQWLKVNACGGVVLKIEVVCNLCGSKLSVTNYLS